jgi:Tfp pilus assembly protein PilX
MMRSPRRLPRKQRGVILFIALIVLVAMSLAGIALMRSVDTNVLIAGNLAFRQGATMSADWGVEAARSWLDANKAGTTLSTDQPVSYYWANWQTGIDLVGVGTSTDDYDWSQAMNLGQDSAGNEVRFVIHRLCQVAGNPTDAASNCMRSTVGTSSSAVTGSPKEDAIVGGGAITTPGTVFYRVTIRVAGPRNTFSYVQAVLN